VIADLPARLRASVALRRLVPTELALIATDALCRVTLRLRPERMTQAVATVDAIVGDPGGSGDHADLTGLATRHVMARARGWELTWRPWQLRRIPVHGVEHLTAARVAGRGLIVSFVHLGPSAGWVALGPLLAPAVLLSNDRLDTPPAPGYAGYQLEHRRRVFRESAIERLHVRGSAMAVYKLLAAGGTAMMSMDIPGDRRVEFLGRPVDLPTGTPELAVRTGALVLPAAMLPEGRRWRIELRPPLDPREFAGVEELHRALLDIHGHDVRRHPEHFESPQRNWPNATRHGWLRD
jgi:lauroyl/myristoyl acyltransferase